jgi:hypothetical protein
MASTYEPIATTTLGSGSSSVLVMSSIPSTYTDLVLIINGTSGSVQNIHWQANGDTASNYSYTRIYGDGTSATSDRASTYAGFAIFGTDQSTAILNIQNYSNTTTYKTGLSRGNTGGYVSAYVSLWRSTAAINSLTIKSASTAFATGSTFTLYGIKAA